MNAAIKSPHLLLFSFAAAFLSIFLFADSRIVLVGIAVLMLSLAYLCSITGYRIITFLLIATLPFSVNVELEDTNAHLLVPSEILIVLVAITYLIRTVFFVPIDKAVWKHPVTRLLLLLILAQFIAALFSTMTLVSGKAMIIKFLYILVFYFVSAEFFRAASKNIVFFCLAYFIPLGGVAVYTLSRHAEFGFHKTYASTAPEPFFADHTIYSLCLVFMLPVLITLAIKAKYWFRSRLFALPFLLAAILFCTAVLFSTSRAAWLSLCVMGLTAIILILRIKALHLALLISAMLIYGLFNLEYIDIAVRSNRYDSKAITADLETQARSITNITNDNSNAERINRWKCSLRMASEKPWTGYGPGTYQFQYLKFQKPEEMTSISITSPYHIEKGKGGTAHNEFLLILAESGVFAFSLFSLLIVFVVYTASRTFRSIRDKKQKAILFAIYLGWISYVCHSMFNNFLDTDKAAFLFYAAMAAIVVLDLTVKRFEE